MLHLQGDFSLKDWVTAVLLLTRAEAPLLARASRGDKVKSATLTYYAQKQVAREWVVKESVNSSATTIKVDQALGARITAGYLLMVGDERIMVTAKWDNAGSGADAYTPLTVIRGWANTTASSISANAVIKILAKAESEFKITEDYKAFGKAECTNVVQTFTKSIYVSKEAAEYEQKAVEDLLVEEREAKFDEQLLEINKTLYYGAQNNDTGDDKRKTMGWWKEAINKAGWFILDADGAITEDKIENALLAIKQRGGNPEAIFMNASTKNYLRKVFKNKYVVEDRRNQGAGTRLTYFTSDVFGRDFEFIIDESIENGDIFIWEGRPIIHVMQDPKENVDVLFADYTEPTNSQVIQETIKSTITAEFRQASKEALIVNAYNANYSAPAIDVNIANTSAIDVNVANDTTHPVNTKEVSSTPSS